MVLKECIDEIGERALAMPKDRLWEHNLHYTGEIVMEDILVLIVITYGVSLGFGFLLQKYLRMHA